jgi:hypothetical protein
VINSAKPATILARSSGWPSLALIERRDRRRTVNSSSDCHVSLTLAFDVNFLLLQQVTIKTRNCAGAQGCLADGRSCRARTLASMNLPAMRQGAKFNGPPASRPAKNGVNSRNRWEQLELPHSEVIAKARFYSDIYALQNCWRS